MLKTISFFLVSLFFLSCSSEISTESKSKKDEVTDTDTVIVMDSLLFEDTFETGGLREKENGISYQPSTNANVSNEVAKDETYSLKFTYEGKASGEDAWAEQRLDLPQRKKITIEYDLFIPSNYTHRNDIPSNNKFLAIFNNDYVPGFQVNWSIYANNDGSSSLHIHTFQNGNENSPKGIQDGQNFISSKDYGKWIKIKAYIKVPASESSSDGVMQLWKNDVLICNEQNLTNYGGAGLNYIDEIYLLGWANSGFSETTYFYLDNLKIY